LPSVSSQVSKSVTRKSKSGNFEDIKEISKLFERESRNFGQIVVFSSYGIIKIWFISLTMRNFLVLV